MKNNERKLVQLIKEEYTNRLLNLYRESVKDILEADMFDKEGHQLLSPGLKVRHKKSGYEYTVDHVEGKDEDAIVYLRHPDAPRFKPPVSQDQLVEGDEDEPKVKVDQVDLQKVMGGSESLDKPTIKTVEDQPTKSLLRITRQEFEKEYEVK